MQLAGKRIIVTGSANGIGAGTVRAYTREGAIVSALGRNGTIYTNQSAHRLPV